MRKIVPARPNSNGLERGIVRALEVPVPSSVEKFIGENASSCLDDSLPHMWVSEYGMWKKQAVYFYLSV